jgi:hypothetical protein
MIIWKPQVIDENMKTLRVPPPLPSPSSVLKELQNWSWRNLGEGVPTWSVPDGSNCINWPVCFQIRWSRNVMQATAITCAVRHCSDLWRSLNVAVEKTILQRSCVLGEIPAWPVPHPRQVNTWNVTCVMCFPSMGRRFDTLFRVSKRKVNL